MVLDSGEVFGVRVAAALNEPIQSGGGINVTPPSYSRRAHELCDRYALLLILDEIECGMECTGKMFCYGHDGAVRDLMALGKGFGVGAMPIEAVVGTPRTWQKYM